MSGLLSIANPRRIKTSHRRRWKGAVGSTRYANDNPYRFTDPDGRYSCSEKAVCRLVANGLKALVKSQANLAKNDPGKAKIVQAAIDQIGTKNDDKGPTYKSGSLDGAAIAATDQRGTTTIDLHKMSSVDRNGVAKNMAHEATHDIDAKTKIANDEAGFRNTETNAYKATQAAALGLGEVITDTQVGAAVEQSVIYDLSQLKK